MMNGKKPFMPKAIVTSVMHKPQRLCKDYINKMRENL
jgi:hypothetical protein